MSFFEELKRRNVIRVGFAYLVGAWIAIQVSETLFPVYGLSDAAIRLVVTILALGFVPVLVLSWVFERTPEGIKRESNIDRTQSITRDTGKRLDRWIIVALMLALSYFVVDKFVLAPGSVNSVETADARSPALEGWEQRDIATDRKAIAVLPFTNMSGDVANEPFTLGIHDDLLTHLSRIKSLKTTSRTSVLQYQDTQKSVPDIGRELGVDYILEGGVQRSGDRVRINFQLIDVRTDEHLWAEIYDRQLTVENLFSVQADVANEVAGSLQATLLPAEQEQIEVQPTRSMAAYDLYLLGRHHQETRTEESLTKAVDYYTQAIEEDPEYVLAYAGLAQSQLLLIGYGNLTGETVFPEARTIIDDALALDDEEVEVWAAQGIYYISSGNNPKAIESLEKAIELDIQNYQAWLWYANSLLTARRRDEHLEALQVAYSLEPMSYPVNVNLASVYSARGDFVRSRQHYERTDLIDEQDQTEWKERIADSYFQSGELVRSATVAREVLALDPANEDAMRYLTDTYLEVGDLTEAQRWSEEAARIEGFSVPGFWLYMARNDFDGAIAYLEDKRELTGAQDIEYIGLMFQAAYYGKKTEAAADFLGFWLENLGGRMEVFPGAIWQWDRLLVADFLMRHGEQLPGGPERGREMLNEIKANLLVLNEQGFVQPNTWVGLAMCHAMSGDNELALLALREAVKGGFLLNSRLRLFPQLDGLRAEPEFAEIMGEIDLKLADQRAALEDVQFAEYQPMSVRERVILSPEVVERYLGYYTDGNIIFRFFLAENGEIMGQPADQKPMPLVPFSETEFYVEMARALTLQFVLDDDGNPTHAEVNQGGSIQRLKVTEPPPQPIRLTQQERQPFLGTFSGLRPGRGRDASVDSDVWTARIFINEEGSTIIHFDDQAPLVLEFSARDEAFIPGFITTLKFESSRDDGVYDRMVATTDGLEMVFDREEAAGG